jgi:hypothetical protein
LTLIATTEVSQIIVDSTVQEKAIELKKSYAKAPSWAACTVMSRAR